jgi:hypothetical protein
MKDFNSEPLSALLLLLTFYALLLYRAHPAARALFLAGAAAGFAVLTRVANLPPALILVAGGLWLAYRRPRGSRLRDVLGLCLPFLAGLGLYALFNFVRFADPLESGYPPLPFDWFPVEGLWFQLFSAERGLFWYNPVLLLAPVGVLLWWCRRRFEVLLLLGWALATVLLYSSYLASPEGGHSAGQRFLVVIVPALLLLALPVLTRLQRSGSGRALATLLLAVSVAVQLPLVTLNVSYYYALEAAENERRGLPPEHSPTPLLWRSWPLAASVVTGAFERPAWIKSLPPRGAPGMTGEQLLTSVRSFYVPYFWWALAYFYGLASPALIAALAALLTLIAAVSYYRLWRIWPRALEGT